MSPALLRPPLARHPPQVLAESLHARLAQLAERPGDAEPWREAGAGQTLPRAPVGEAGAPREPLGSPAGEPTFWSFSPSPPGSPTLQRAATARSPASPGPASPTGPKAQLGSPNLADVRRRRRPGMAHGDNTSGALRYAKPLGAEFAAAHSGHIPHTHTGAAPLPGAEAPWLQRLAMGLPLQLVPLVGSVPALVNNMRHAQRSVAWWRYFSALDRSLAAQLHKAVPTPPATARSGAASGAQLPALLAQWRSGKACERLAVRMALCEARFNLSFNAVELLSYAAGLLPLALQALRGKAAIQDSFAAKALPLLLLASGVLHVVQRASWFLAACQIRHAVQGARDLSWAARDLLLLDAHAACRFHGLQLGFWSAFSVGLLAASGGLTTLGMGPVTGAVLVVASMLGAKLQRLWAPRRFDVPDSAIWEVDQGVEQMPSLHRIRTFAAPTRQEAALLSLQEQAACLHALEAQVLARHTTPWRAWVLRTLLFFHEAPGAAAILGVLSGRWFCGPGRDPAPTLLAGYCRFWRTQQKLIEAERRAVEACLLQLEGACTQAAQSGPLADALCTLRAEQRHAAAALSHEATRLSGQIAAAEGWLKTPPAAQGEIWAALQETWRLHPGGPGAPASLPKDDWLPRPAVGAVLLEARRQLEDWQTSLIWGAKLGCLQRSKRGSRPWQA